MLLETASRSTRENALLSVRLLRAERPRLKHLLVVTNRFHLRRACAAFARAAAEGYQGSLPEVHCAPAGPSLGPTADLSPRRAAKLAAAARAAEGGAWHARAEVLMHLLKEPAAMLLYWARGWV